PSLGVHASESRRDAPQVEQERRNLVSLPQRLGVEVVRPAERHRPTIAGETVKLEFLECQCLEVVDQPPFLTGGNDLGSVLESRRPSRSRRLLRLEESQLARHTHSQITIRANGLSRRSDR